MREVKNLNKFLREVMKTPSLEIFKSQLDKQTWATYSTFESCDMILKFCTYLLGIMYIVS